MHAFTLTMFVIYTFCVCAFVADAAINREKRPNYFATLWCGAIATWAGFLLWGN
jgi:hypothetical protein